MINILRITLFVFLLVPVSEAVAQKRINAADDVYGSDPLLYNGRLYTAFYRINAENNQYLVSGQFEPGTVTIRGVRYTGLMLNYDIYNQQLLLEYEGNTDFKSVIIISDAWLESFTIGNRQFIKLRSPDNGSRYYQEIGSGSTRVLYFWKKYLQFDNVSGTSKSRFSKPVREMSLITNGETVKYTNNRSFVKLFGPEKKKEIRVYLNSHHINVKKAGDEVMEQLIIFCNTPGAK